MSVFSVDDADEVDCDGGRDKASASSRSEFESSPSCLRATYHFALVTEVDSGVYIVLISCVISWFGVSSILSRLRR